MRIVTKDAEARLIELLNLIDENRAGWQVLCLSFSKLLDHYRSEYQIKIATNLMNDLLGDHDGAIYVCDDVTIYAVVRNFAKTSMDKMIFQLRYLFMDDPLAYTPDGDENPDFSTLYQLESQFPDFMEICKRRLVLRMRGRQQVSGMSTAPAPAMAPASAKTIDVPKMATPSQLKEMRLFTAGNLAAIEHDLQKIDLSPTIRRQPVCAAIPQTGIRTVFDEMYININHLRQSMGIEVDLLSNRWLFKYLTQVLDYRMLDMVQEKPSVYLANPVSLNLNVQTILSERFAQFDKAIRPNAKVSVVVEIQVADVFTDMAAFLIAKDIAQKMGYRVCLDGMTDLSFMQIDRQRLGFDFVKLSWNADEQLDTSSDHNQRLEAAIRQCGNNRVILTRCDNEKAIEFGQALGLTLFQGRHLDTIINPKSTVMN